MDSLLELQRQYHEENEHLFRAAVELSIVPPKTQREKIVTEHRIKKLCERISSRSKSLLDAYNDVDGLRKQEIAAISGPNEATEFYTRLQSVREYHKRYPNEIAEPMQLEFMSQPREDGEEEEASFFKDKVEFSGEEGHGKYLDLHMQHEAFLNLKGIVEEGHHVEYLRYITDFHKFHTINKRLKNTAYKKYLDQLLSYLKDYYGRAFPLRNLGSDLDKADKAFEEAWREGAVPGWPESNKQQVEQAMPLDLTPFASSTELEAVGMERLKSALMALGMKCGGTLEQRAQRLFMTKGRALNTLDKSLFAKPPGNGATGATGAQGGASAASEHKEIARTEARIAYIMENVLSETQQQTKDNVERKQARTADELEEEEEAAAAAVLSDDEEEAQQEFYNPKDVPLGWDGKPIPYWLYRLHGLNQYFQCEICGDQSYRGPKAFHDHFSEWRHAHGMRLLGIPNTAHFHNVTKIDDARALWDKLKKIKAAERFSAMDEEEYEDSMGNVVTKKTYEDLMRQGLL